MDFFNKIKLYLFNQSITKDFEHENPENWKWGVFYFNKKDFRFIVPKRNPIMGWTFNFAHPISFITLIVIIGVVVFRLTFNK